MEKQRLDAVISALTAKSVTAPCSKCGNPHWEVVGESYISINEDPNVFVVGGPVIPTVLVACNRCGFLTQHAQGPLGLLRNPNGAQ